MTEYFLDRITRYDSEPIRVSSTLRHLLLQGAIIVNTFLKLLFFAALIAAIAWAVWVLQESEAQQVVVGSPRAGAGNNSCLLYTSDAADE